MPPTKAQIIEAEIWVACVDGIRDWTPKEKKWIRNHEIELNLVHWWESTASQECWTEANAKFMAEISKGYAPPPPIQRYTITDPDRQRELSDKIWNMRREA